MMKNNYRDNDSLTLYVKKNKSEEIISYYNFFGWELVVQDDNSRYEDLIDLTFTRPHKMKNKDELQLQQIYMEEALNKMGKLERHKHSRITAFGLCLGVLSLISIFLGVYCGLKLKSLWGIIGGMLFAVIGVVAVVIEAFIFPKMYKRIDELYEIKHKDLELELRTICERATCLTRSDYGEN